MNVLLKLKVIIHALIIFKSVYMIAAVFLLLSCTHFDIIIIIIRYFSLLLFKFFVTYQVVIFKPNTTKIPGCRMNLCFSTG
jgi:hypothetical protein